MKAAFQQLMTADSMNFGIANSAWNKHKSHFETHKFAHAIETAKLHSSPFENFGFMAYTGSYWQCKPCNLQSIQRSMSHKT